MEKRREKERKIITRQKKTERGEANIKGERKRKRERMRKRGGEM